jgi:outer membrane protein assembly factor BamB
MILLLILSLVLPTADGAAKRPPEVARSFVRAWRYETVEMTDVRVAADASIIVLPLADGKLIALNPADGNLLWSADPGGRISTPPLVAPDAIYIATSRDDANAEGILRALDRTTGLTLWSRDLPKLIVSEMSLADNWLFCGAGDGALYALRADTGATVWAFATRGPVRGQLAFRGSEVLFGSDDGALYAVNRETGNEVWRYQTTGPVVGRPAWNGRRIVLTSGDGAVYAIDAATQRLLWRQRTGAAIEAAPVLVGERVLVASFDNFVYLLDGDTGDRVWKRRMRRRLVSEPFTDNTQAIVAPLRDTQLSILALRDGKKIAAFALDPGDELVAPPTLSGSLLLLPTESGLVAARRMVPQ